MADQRGGGIAWTEQTWNPIRGCSRISEGCRNCYAERVAARFNGPGAPYEGLTTNGRWNGTVRVLDDAHLLQPLRWQRPRMIFVNSMSDLFHEHLADADIGKIFSVMAEAHWHTFQVLTKRADRLAAWSRGVAHYPRGDSRQMPRVGWPPNVWVGVSAEDQETWDARVPKLLEVQAAVRWVSVEPQIAPVSASDPEELRALQWVVVGGESGPGARPFDLQWVRQWVEACRYCDVPLFVKQLGANPVPAVTFDSRKGGNPEEWPPDLRVREYPTPGVQV